MSERAIARIWAKVTGGLVGGFASVAVFTRTGRFAPCPMRPGAPAGCDGPWTNVLGWRFHGGFQIWVPIVAAMVGFAAGWFLVAMVETLIHREKASALR